MKIWKEVFLNYNGDVDSSTIFEVSLRCIRIKTPMRNYIPTLLLGMAAIFVVSCQKETPDTPDSNPLVGNWKFIGITAHTNTTSQTSFGSSVLKNITLSDYTTINNAGTIAINTNTFAGAGITYQIDDFVKTYMYEDNDLIDSMTLPFQVTLPSSNSSSNYQLIGQDSIYFNGQGFFSTRTSTTIPAPSGARFTIDGAILKMTTAVVKDSSVTNSGVTQSSHQAASVIITMEKQ